MRFLAGIALALFCIAIPIALWIGIRLIPGPPSELPKVSYVELVTILLTGITIVLAVLAVIVGGLAFWGYQGIKNEANAVAERAVMNALDKAIARHLTDDKIQAKIRKEQSRIMRQYAGSLYGAAFPRQATTERAKPSRHIAEEYPKGKQS